MGGASGKHPQHGGNMVNKTAITKIYKETRTAQRNCLVVKVKEDIRDEKKKVNEQLTKALAESNDKLKVIQKERDAARKIEDGKINAIYKEQDKIRNTFDEKFTALRLREQMSENQCNKTFTKELREFDLETNKKILDFLNGVTQTLTI